MFLVMYMEESIVIDKVQKKVLLLALHAGEIMLKSGAEVYRVEDTINRICRACRIPYIECFATTTGIFLSLDNGEEDSDVYTLVKRLHGSKLDLEKISKINNFSRIFTTTDLSIDEGVSIINQIDHITPYPLWLRLFGAAFVSAFVCLMFAGTALSGLLAGIIGLLTYAFSGFIEKIEFHNFLRILLSCSFCTFLSIISAELLSLDSYSPLVIGTITVFLPGVSITNAARDLLSGDMLAGTARAMEAGVSAIAIASGVGLILKLLALTGGFLQ